MIFATALFGLAFRQAQVAAANDVVARNKALPPPVKTKHAVRPPPAVFSGDVVADYVARCEKGMTDQEIRWILEDFRNAGLYLDWRNPNVTAQDLFRLRAAQHRWYLDALSDGLHLSPQQKADATEKLTPIFKKAQASYLEDAEAAAAYLKQPKPSPFGTNDSSRDFTDSLKEELINPKAWIQLGTRQDKLSWGETCMPWKLCALTPEQSKITWKDWFEVANQESDDSDSATRPEIADRPPVPGAPSFMQREPMLFFSDEFIPSLPYGVNYIFPLIHPQRIVPIVDLRKPLVGLRPEAPAKLMENLRALHPAQLRILLLLHPQMAVEIQSAFDLEN